LYILCVEGRRGENGKDFSKISAIKIPLNNAVNSYY
jgi:hypothetical protein